MKTIKILTVLIFCLGLLFGSTSCAVRPRTDNGNHKGWHKNSNTPHGNNSPKPGKLHVKHRR